MNNIAAEILIVGGGAAGMSAALAVAESSDSGVLIVDNNPAPGGQIWRSELGRVTAPAAQKLIRRIDRSRIKTINSTQVFGAFDQNCLLADTDSGSFELQFEKVILATGARERYLPFPNWTLPNIFGAAGLQALVKGGLPVADKRIVVAGTGPLLLAVADYLRSKGARVLLIAEQASRSDLLKFGIGLWRYPGKLAEAAALRVRLAGTRYLNDCFVSGAVGKDKLEAVNLTRNGRNRTVECDMLACGFHVVPNTELASLLGCRLKNGFVEVGRLQETSVKNVFCAGEPTGIGGVETSLVEGRIAGYAAAGQIQKAEKIFDKRAAQKRFADALNATFHLRSELKDSAVDGAIACRCEDVAVGRLRKFSAWREAKLRTRCGMGSCQGRICGPIAEFLFDWKDFSVRPPAFPVRMSSLAHFAADDEQ